jgi:hypothetical protein
MKVGVLGTGDVGQSLGKAFVALGHQVLMGSRVAPNEKAVAWARATGSAASTGTFADAARFGELVVLATLGTAAASALQMAGTDHLAGKLLLDTSNPLDFSGGLPRLSVGHTDSLGEQVQRLVPKARVVKAFNTVGHGHMFRPAFPDGPPDMFVCGNDEGAKRQTSDLLSEFGWNTIDLGGIEASRYLEPMCLVWVLHGIRTGTWNHAFKLLRK